VWWRKTRPSAHQQLTERLSERMRRGRDFLLLKCLKACRKHSTVRSVTISKCTARVSAQVNRHTYTSCSGSPLTNNAPVKSTPVTSKGMDCCMRAFTSGGGSSAVRISCQLPTGYTLPQQSSNPLSCTGHLIHLTKGSKRHIYPCMVLCLVGVPDEE